MPAPSQLSIATSSLQRLIKEEASYHSELEMQQKSIARHEKQRTSEQDDESGNQAFLLEQEVCLNPGLGLDHILPAFLMTEPPCEDAC